MKTSSQDWLSKFGAALVVISLCATFVRLGIWQLDRAADFQELQKPYVEQSQIELEKIASPGENLSDDAINRIVNFKGKYIEEFIAPNQIDKFGLRSDWQIGLLQVSTSGAILVIRGSGQYKTPDGEVMITGRLFNRQVEDRAGKGEGELSRLDPGLLAGRFQEKLFDGYVLAILESSAGAELAIKRIELDPAKPSVPGYYWQHISYVVIWWLMALVVLFLPFYSRVRRKQG